MTIIRLQDTVHGLIAFNLEDAIDSLAWKLIQTKEFQRLRRIKQMGFSDYVYPGATHSRFAHSIGVFSNARRLIKIISEQTSNADEERSIICAIAALLHDIGHGPFSHAFEGAGKIIEAEKMGVYKKHEEWTTEIILGDTEINKVLKDFDQSYPQRIADVFLGEYVDIYSSIVSSSFDADRLDFLQRDRYMAGLDDIHFDFEWLLSCLEIKNLNASILNDSEINNDVFIVNHKGLRAAESYIYARCKLYELVAHHKTSKSAEKMLQALFLRLKFLLANSNSKDIGLNAKDPVYAYLKTKKPDLKKYLMLDDNQVWGTLQEISLNTKDDLLRSLADGLINRKLYKCFDPKKYGLKSFSLNAFQEKIKTLSDFEWNYTLLEDKYKIHAYSSWEEEKSIEKHIFIKGKNDKVDIISDVSKVVKALNDDNKEPVYRYFVPNDDLRQKLIETAKEVIRES